MLIVFLMERYLVASLKKINDRSKVGFLIAFCCMFIASSLGGCAYKAIAPYNQATFDRIGKIERKCNRLLSDIKRSVIAPKKNKQPNFERRYLSIGKDIGTFQTEQAAIHSNELTVKQLGLLQETIQDIQKLHNLGIDSPAQIEVLREQLRIIFTALKKLENSKPKD